MARVQKRVNLNGATVYVVSGGRPTAPTGPRAVHHQEAASAFAAARENDRARGVDYDPNAGKVLFRDAATAWLTARPDLKETTRAAYADALAPTTIDRHDSEAP